MSNNPPLSWEKLGNNDLKLLQSISKYVHFKKGEKIFLENEPSSHIYVLIEGFVELSKMIKSKNVKVRHIITTQLIGESIPSEKKRYPLSAHFITNGIVMKIDYRLFRQMVIWSPNFSFKLFAMMNHIQKSLSLEIEKKSFLKTSEEVALFLYQNHMLLPQLKHKEIASILYLSSALFSKNIKKLQDMNLITIKNREIKVDRKKLKTYFSEKVELYE